jgi:hypothetical protein
MIGDNMIWGSDYPKSESTFPQSRKILAEILGDEQAKIVGSTPLASTTLTWRG